MTTEKLLKELIALPSINPSFAPKDSPFSGEATVAQFLSQLAKKAGMTVQTQKVLPGRFNVIFRVAPRSRTIKHRLMLAPHMDTVGGQEIPGDLFKPVKKNGRLHGRGACDTKGSIAAMFSALTDVVDRGPRPAHTEILFVGLVDEENAQAGSRAFVRKKIRADLAIVGEPTQLKVVTAHKGDLWLRLTTRGKAAHGARPELGRNAIHEMSRVVDLLETKYAASIQKLKHPILGRATVNVGMIQGGKQPNIVPEHCHIRIDRRTLPGEKDSQVKRELVAFLKKHGLRVKLDDTKGFPSVPLETNPDLPLVRGFLNVARQGKPVGVDFFSDAGVLGAGGIPSILFGPGNIDQAHTADEWISLHQLDQARRMLVRFFKQLP